MASTSNGNGKGNGGKGKPKKESKDIGQGVAVPQGPITTPSQIPGGKRG